MRLLLPRAQFWFAVLLMLGTFWIARDSWNELSRVAVLTEPQKHDASIQVFGGVVTFFIGLAMFIQALRSEFPLRVVNENFTGKIELRGGETFVVGPLYGLAQTQLIIVLRDKTAAPPRPHFRSFRLYRGTLPQKPEAKFVVQLFGRDGQRETLLARDRWPNESGIERDENGEPICLELDVPQEHETYFLRVQIEDAPVGNAVSETTIKLGVALKMRDAARLQKPNLGAARLEKVA